MEGRTENRLILQGHFGPSATRNSQHLPHVHAWIYLFI